MDAEQKKLVKRTRAFLIIAPIVLLILLVFRLTRDEPPPQREYRLPTRETRRQIEREVREMLERRNLDNASSEQDESPSPTTLSELLDRDRRREPEKEEEQEILDLLAERRSARERFAWPQTWPRSDSSPQGSGARGSTTDARAFGSVQGLTSLRYKLSFDPPEPPQAPITTRARASPLPTQSPGRAPRGRAPRAEDQAEPERITDRVLLQGSLIPAILVEPANTDEPGTVTAYVQQNVFDSLTGRRLLLPVGTRAIGRVSGLNGSKTALEIEWTRLIRPDGVDIRIEGSATDPDGAGASGRRKTRVARKVGAVLTSAIAAAAVQLAQRPPSTGQFFDAGQLATEEAVNDAGRILDPWAQEQLSRPPTVYLPIGAAVRIKVERDLEIRTK